MSRKRDVLEELKPDELRTAVDRFELPVVDRRVKGELVEALAGSRKAGLTAILAALDLSRDRLKELCRALGLDDSGREKAVLIARLAGEAPATPSPTQSAPPPPKQTPTSPAASTHESTGASATRSSQPRRTMAIKKSEL